MVTIQMIGVVTLLGIALYYGIKALYGQSSAKSALWFYLKTLTVIVLLLDVIFVGVWVFNPALIQSIFPTLFERLFIAGLWPTALAFVVNY